MNEAEIQDKVYKSDNAFFGDESSNFALFCFNYIKTNKRVKKILDLGTGHDKDPVNIQIIIEREWKSSSLSRTLIKALIVEKEKPEDKKDKSIINHIAKNYSRKL